MVKHSSDLHTLKDWSPEIQFWNIHNPFIIPMKCFGSRLACYSVAPNNWITSENHLHPWPAGSVDASLRQVTARARWHVVASPADPARQARCHSPAGENMKAFSLLLACPLISMDSLINHLCLFSFVAMVWCWLLELWERIANSCHTKIK